MEIQGKTVFPFIWKGGSPMLTAYKHDENHRLCPVAFEEMEKGSWINCAAPDAAELEKLNALTGIPSIPSRPLLTVKNVPTWNWKTILFSLS